VSEEPSLRPMPAGVERRFCPYSSVFVRGEFSFPPQRGYYEAGRHEGAEKGGKSARFLVRGAMQVRFGEFTLDTESRQLKQGDAERHLSPKAFELLRLLLENRPRALSKSELHERLWPSTFVSEASLTSLVAEIRDALGERAGRARFVRTVHRFGYAFGGTVTELAPRAQSPDDRVRCWIIWEWGQVGLRDGEHLLGRDGDVAVWLESPTVSRHHARIRVAGAHVTIEDLESKNGTYLRGERLSTPSPLSDGDEIRLGSVLVKFRMSGTGGVTETQHSR
jgi:DNA-binding winged helix-turn-helix (wHTH) protein